MRPFASALAAVVLAAGGLLAALPAPARADAHRHSAGIACGLVNGILPGPVGDAAGSACDATGGAISSGIGAINDITGLHLPTSVGGAVSSLAQAGANTVLNGVSGWIASGAVWLMSRVSNLIQSTTHPQLTSGWFAARYRTMVDLAFALALPLLLFAVLRSLWTRDVSELGRSVLIYLPLAAVLTGAAVVVTQMGIDVTDQLSATVSRSVGGDAHSFMQGATKGMIIVGAGSAVAGAPELPGFVVAIGAIIAACAAFVLWLELVLREAAIYVAVIFLPLSFVALIWPATARVARRAVEALAAIVLSKFVVVAIIALAASGLVHSGLGDSFSAALAGTALMLLACFAPWVLLKMLPLMEAAVAHHGHTRAAVAGAPFKAMHAHDMVRNAIHANHGSEATSRGGLGPAAASPTRASSQGGVAAASTTGNPVAAAASLWAAGAAAAGTAAARRAKTGGAAASSANTAPGVDKVAGSDAVTDEQRPTSASNPGSTTAASTSSDRTGGLSGSHAENSDSAQPLAAQSTETASSELTRSTAANNREPGPGANASMPATAQGDAMAQPSTAVPLVPRDQESALERPAGTPPTAALSPEAVLGPPPQARAHAPSELSVVGGDQPGGAPAPPPAEVGTASPAPGVVQAPQRARERAALPAPDELIPEQDDD